MAYSTVVHYFESNQVTKFSLDLNTGVITMTLKEGNSTCPTPPAASTAGPPAGCFPACCPPLPLPPPGRKKNDDGTVTVRYKLPYARMFVKTMWTDYIAPSTMQPTPMRPWCTTCALSRRTIPWMEILFYLAMLGCTGFFALLHDARRRWRRRDYERGQGQGEG